MIVTLPTPPSANGLFFNRSPAVRAAAARARKPRRGRGRTEAYEGWIESAGWALKLSKPESFSVPVFVTLEAQENPRRDLDSYWKPVLDLLVRHQVIPNDNCAVVKEIRASWSRTIQGCRVTVMPWVEYL